MARDTTPDVQAGDDPGATDGAAADLSPVVESTADAGRRERARLSRRVLGQHQPAADRPDPIAILEQQGTTRLQELLPIRYGRMAVSPFTFYRGAAAVMAADLSAAPQTRLRAQLCGDAHLSNFGIYRSPERSLVFDLNDFDETLAGPFEWDAKRLAASFIVAGRSLGWPRSQGHRALLYAMGSYRLRMGEYARAGALETWYSRITIDDLISILPREAPGIERIRKLAVKRDNLGALNKLTTVVDGRRQLKSLPPLLERLPVDDQQELVHSLFRQYRRSLAPERRVLIDRYRFVDIAHKVVGVGSVGTRCWVLYFEGPRRRPAVPPGEGGDGLGPRAVPRASGPEAPWPARRPRPEADAGRERRVPGLDDRTPRARTTTGASCGTRRSRPTSRR